MYFVLRIYPNSGFTPSVMFQTDSAADASIYARVMERNQPEYNFMVVKEFSPITKE